ncbi:hypothetical protein JKA74_20445 [Marivirga sp. S37H4]|uniref:Uncharacterized protein n=1 Tax=Marivirga aurantiaca TaxID=2802615 RepID=A0A934X1T1_9BACT|nr:hypothetical protein [Marivirga aurantiaca]MBK6267423.1 hypothetical protein [Marivirga aurantiaca]
MKKSRVFIVMTIIFVAIILYIFYDMASRTKFPGGKNKNVQTNSTRDSIYQDTMKIEIRRNEPDR